MNFELNPVSGSGQRFVALAERHAADFAARADQHDRDGSFVFENVEAMQASGMLAACVPADLGGLGLESAHDFALGFNRLGRGDPSTAISTTMHVAISWSLHRLSKKLKALGAAQQAAGLDALLDQIGAAKVVICDPVSEAGTDLLHPLTEAVRVDGGWNVNGRKVFASLSPAANLILITFRVPSQNGDSQLAMTLLPHDRKGIENLNDWDGLGMRASGSHTIVFKDCIVGEAEVMDLGPWGSWNEPFLDLAIFSTLGLVAAFLGIAEAARDDIVELVNTRRKAPSGKPLAERYSIQHAIAEIEIDLAAARALISCTGRKLDAFYDSYPNGNAPMGELHLLNKGLQCAKWFVTRKAIEIVDRALTLSGGSGYLQRSPLARMYRDVRAGPFMQPFSPNEAFEYIGKVTLGLEPRIDS